MRALDSRSRAAVTLPWQLAIISAKYTYQIKL